MVKGWYKKRTKGTLLSPLFIGVARPASRAYAIKKKEEWL